MNADNPTTPNRTTRIGVKQQIAVITEPIIPVFKSELLLITCSTIYCSFDEGC